MGLETALALLGRYGRWQMVTYILLCLLFCLPASWQLFAIVFIGVTTKHHCRVPSNVTVEAALPMMADGQVDSCSMYVNSSLTNATTSCKSGWEYDLEGFDPQGTIVMEWDLVCRDSWYVETSQTIFGIGNIIGAAVCTPLADRFGRKKPLFLSLFLMGIFGLAKAFSPSYMAFCIFQFLTGIFSQGLIWTGFVIACEIFSSEQRALMAPLAYLFWSVGMVTLTLWAYVIRHWRSLQMYISIGGLCGVLFYWGCPESLRWLVAVDKIDEASSILKWAAKINRVEMPENILDRPDSGIKHHKTTNKKVTMLALFRSPKARRNVLIMCYMVFVNNLMYFGLSLMTSALPGDRYTNFFCVAILEVPATIMATLALKWIGRRWPVCFSHLFSAGFLALAAVFTSFPVPGMTDFGNGYLVTALALAGKFGVASAYVIELIYQQEIYPTAIRATGVGITAAVGMLASVVAPYAVFLFRLIPWVPTAVFAILSVFAGIIALWEPEMLGRQLPESIEEIENWTIAVSNEEKSLQRHQMTRSTGKGDVQAHELVEMALTRDVAQDCKTEVPSSDSGCFLTDVSSEIL